MHLLFVVVVVAVAGAVVEPEDVKSFLVSEHVNIVSFFMLFSGRAPGGE